MSGAMMRAMMRAGAGALAALAGLAAGSSGAAAAPAGGGLTAICGECRFVRYADCGEFLEGINFDRHGNIWAVSLLSGDVIEVVDARCHVRAKTGGRANGARFHKDGRLFITDNQRGVIAFDPATGQFAVIADHVGTAPMVAANDLVFDAQGGLYVTVPGHSSLFEPTGQLVYIAPGSHEARVIADRLPFPNGVTLTPDGKFVMVGLYAAKTIANLPAVTNPGTYRGPYAFVHTEGGIGPDGLAMDRDGRLWWAEFLAGAVGVADADGFVLGTVRLPGGAGLNTTNLAFHDGWLYVTEADKGTIWRMRVAPAGAHLFGD